MFSMSELSIFWYFITLWINLDCSSVSTGVCRFRSMFECIAVVKLC